MSHPDQTRADAANLSEAPPTRVPLTDLAPPLDSLQTRAPSSYPDTRCEPRSPVNSIATRAPDDTYATVVPKSTSAEGREIPPNAFPGFEMLETLGEGGMGIVYKARQEGLNRLVALKVILGGRRIGPKDLIRFLAEAEAVASIKHPHVVQVHEYGEVDDRPFLAMEYLPGGSLSDRLKRDSKLEPREAAELVAKLAGAVQAAHDQEIVHRDLKPGNVLFDAQGEPKLTDFGLAKRAKGTDLTQTQAVMGTPAYMSPEQAQGKTKFVGPPADVYALGVILYECLTGVRPFHDDDTHVLLRKVVEDEPARLSHHLPGIPRDLELITLKCLAKDPAERYPSAEALADDIARFLAGKPVSVRVTGILERAVKWARRKRTLAVAYALTAAVVILLAFGATVASFWWKAERARGTAEMAKKSAEQAQIGEREARMATEIALKGEKQARSEVEIARDKLERIEYGRTIQVAYLEWRDNKIASSLAHLDGTSERLRGWEWKYVRNLSHGELLEIYDNHIYLNSRSGSPKQLMSSQTSVSWSPDGSRLATVGPYTAKVWDARTGAETLRLEGGMGGMSSVSWSPDGLRLVTNGRDGMAWVWDARTGVKTLALKGHTAKVTSVSWSPDGSRIATSSGDKTAKIWDAKTGAESMTLDGHSSGVTCLSWSPDSSQLATVSGDGYALVWDLKGDPKILKRLPEINKKIGTSSLNVSFVSWSPDGSRIAVVSRNALWILNLQAKTEILLFRGQISAVTSVSWKHDGSRIAGIIQDGMVKVWDARSGGELLTLKGHTAQVTSISWSPDGSRLATASKDDTARIWDANPSSMTDRSSGALTRYGANSSWSPDGSRLALPVLFGAVQVWDTRSGAATTLPQTRSSGNVTSLSWSPDGSRIATACSEDAARILDSQSGKEVLALRGHLVSWRPDGSQLATAAKDNSIRVWDARSGAQILSLDGHKGKLNRLSWSPDGTRIASASDDGTARVWDTGNGKETLILQGVAMTVLWNPDGSRLATASRDGTARVWDARSGAEILTLQGQLMSWSRDGSRLATASESIVQVWDARSGSEVLTLKGHIDSVRSASWSPDGSRIATSSNDGTARVWDARCGAEVLTLKGQKDHLTEASWSPDGSCIATTEFLLTTQIWDARSCAERLAASP